MRVRQSNDAMADRTDRYKQHTSDGGASVAEPAADAYMPTGDTLSTYMREIRQVNRLTREEEVALSTARRTFDEQAADWVRALSLRTGLVDGPYACDVGSRLRNDARVAMCGSSAGQSRTIEAYYETVRSLRARYAAELRDDAPQDIKAAVIERMGRVQPRRVNAILAALQAESEACGRALRTMRAKGRSRLTTVSAAGDALAKKRDERARRKLEEMDRTQVLPVDELMGVVASLSDLLRESHDIADRLAETNLRLVASIARSFTTDRNTLMDLVQEGNLALMNAARYFDPERGCAFSTFAATAIRRQIGEYLAKESTVLHVSQGMHKRSRQVRAAKDAVRADAQSGGDVHEPTLEEVAQYLGTDTENVVQTLDAVQIATRLDVPIGEGHAPRIDLIADESAEDPCDTLDAFESFTAMTKALSLLTERERRVLEQRYAHDSVVADTLQSVGDDLGVTRERVRQIESRALRKLRCPK